MIEIHRTFDTARVEEIVKNPRVWAAGLMHDEVPSREAWHLPEDLLMLIAWRGLTLLGAFVFEDCPDGYKAHLCMLPTAWGKTSAVCCLKAIEWIREHTQASRLIAPIPEFNRSCLALVQRIGMRLIEVDPQGFKKDGNPVAKHIYELAVKR